MDKLILCHFIEEEREAQEGAETSLVIDGTGTSKSVP